MKIKNYFLVDISNLRLPMLLNEREELKKEILLGKESKNSKEYIVKYENLSREINKIKANRFLLIFIISSCCGIIFQNHCFSRNLTYLLNMTKNMKTDEKNSESSTKQEAPIIDQTNDLEEKTYSKR